MRDVAIEQKMFDMAVALINQRYPKGWGGAGVVRTEDDSYFTSIFLDNINASLNLCIETRAMIEAYKHNRRVTHSLGVAREDEEAAYEILSPCGICQERLRFWGKEVMVGVTTPDNSLKFVSLEELMPHHWSNVGFIETLEDFEYNLNKNKI